MIRVAGKVTFMLLTAVVTVVLIEEVELAVAEGALGGKINFERAPINRNGSGALPIGVKVSIYDIKSFDTAAMMYKINMFVIQEWSLHANRCEEIKTMLRKNEETIGEGDEFVLVNKEMMEADIWFPDTILATAEEEVFPSSVQSTRIMTIRIRRPDEPFGSQCEMSMVSKTIASMGCTLVLTNYPFDLQKCIVRMSSFSYTVDNVIYYWDEPIEMSPHIQPTEQQVFVGRMEQYERKPYNTTEYSTLEFTIYFDRLIGHHLIAFFSPMILIVWSSVAAFWLHSTADRVTLTITSLLAVITQTNEARSGLPSVSYIIFLDYWIIGSILLVFITLVESVILHHLNWLKEERDKKRPRNTTAAAAATATTDHSAGPPSWTHPGLRTMGGGGVGGGGGMGGLYPPAAMYNVPHLRRRHGRIHDFPAVSGPPPPPPPMMGILGPGYGWEADKDPNGSGGDGNGCLGGLWENPQILDNFSRWFFFWFYAAYTVMFFVLGTYVFEGYDPRVHGMNWEINLAKKTTIMREG